MLNRNWHLLIEKTFKLLIRNNLHFLDRDEQFTVVRVMTISLGGQLAIISHNCLKMYKNCQSRIHARIIAHCVCQMAFIDLWLLMLSIVRNFLNFVTSVSLKWISFNNGVTINVAEMELRSIMSKNFVVEMQLLMLNITSHTIRAVLFS